MPNFKELECEEARHRYERARLVKAIQDEINALPDNPRIRRLPGSPRAFVIGSRDLFASGNLTVEHHDFKSQYERVAAEIGKAVDPAARLRQVISEGKLAVRKEGPAWTITLHPDVVDHLARLAGMAWTSNAEWPKGTCPGDASSDLHGSRSQAESVCGMLRSRGFGGEGKVFPKRTWVEAKGPENA